MATVPTQICIDANIKNRPTNSLESLGGTCPEQLIYFFVGASCVSAYRITVEVPQYSRKVLDAMKEVKSISRTPDVPGYTNMDDLRNALDK